MAREHYSDLQVVVEDSPKYPIASIGHEHGAEEKQDNVAVESPGEGLLVTTAETSPTIAQKWQRRRICGLTVRTFWTIIILVLVIVGAVAGGVASFLVERDTSARAQASISQSASSAPADMPTPTILTVSVTTSTLVGPSGTIYVDCPSSNNTIYTPPSSKQEFRKFCGAALVNINDIAASVTENVRTMDDCINQCAAWNTQQAAGIEAGTASLCNSVCWRSSPIDSSGWCYGYTTSNSSGTFQIQSNDKCNSAALINQ